MKLALGNFEETYKFIELCYKFIDRGIIPDEKLIIKNHQKIFDALFEFETKLNIRYKFTVLLEITLITLKKNKIKIDLSESLFESFRCSTQHSKIFFECLTKILSISEIDLEVEMKFSVRYFRYYYDTSNKIADSICSPYQIPEPENLSQFLTYKDSVRLY